MLSIQGLTKTYGNGVRALDDVSLEIPNGMFGLLGPNGAGKSTLMRTIAALQPPDGGSLTFDGIDILKDPQAIRRVLGYLPQDFGVYPRISAENMLMHMAALKGISGARARKDLVRTLLEQTNLYHVRGKALATFSGGMRQRFGIAQALIGEPKLIIVDEPTAGLDPEERNRFHNLLSEIGEQVVVILSTHIVDDVADLCPRMAIMAQGRFAKEGEPQALIAELRGRIWRASIDKADLPALRASQRVISSRLSGGRTIVHVEAAAAPSGFEAAEPTLEDVYFTELAAREPDAAAA